MSEIKTGVIPDIAEQARQHGIATHKTTIEIPGDLKGRLGSLHQRKGTLQLTAVYLLNLLDKELERNGIITYDPDRYEHAVAGLRLVLGEQPRSSVTHHNHTGHVPVGQAVEGHERAGTSGVAQQTTGHAELSNAPVASPAKRSAKSRGSKAVGGQDA